MRRKTASSLLLLPSALGVAAFFLLPLLLVLGSSLGEGGFACYARTLRNPMFRLGAGNFLLFSLVAMATAMAVSLGLALLLRRMGRGAGPLLFCLLLPFVVPSGSTAFFWNSVFGLHGVINRLLYQWGLPVVMWDSTRAGILIPVVIYLWRSCGFFALVLLVGLRQIPEDILDGFLDQELARISRDLHGLRVVYTPLNGAGLECVTRALQKAGVDDIAIVPQQRQPDGTFPTCPAPNPEDPEAMALGLRLCKETQADLLLATDPDCDRVGVAAKDGGRYRLISGNQMGVLLLDYLCKTRKLSERPVAFTTIVSTEMASAVADRYGMELKRTLTGFKYIGEQIGLLEQKGETERFLFGFEESYGYLSSPHVRDKDAVNACLLICEMTAHYKEQGQTLWQVWNELEHDYGVYTERLCSFAFPGADGFQRMCGIMEHLRSQAPEQIAGAAVKQVIDYKEAEKTGLPASDVLAFHLDDDSCVIIRPSGTEPKMKAYLSCKSDTKTEGIEHIARLENEVREMIKA